MKSIYAAPFLSLLTGLQLFSPRQSRYHTACCSGHRGSFGQQHTNRTIDAEGNQFAAWRSGQWYAGRPEGQPVRAYDQMLPFGARTDTGMRIRECAEEVQQRYFFGCSIMNPLKMACVY